MKKKNLFILLLVFMLFPITIFASTFDGAKNRANAYYSNFDTFDKYLRNDYKLNQDRRLPFDFNLDEKKPINNSNFLTGGMISYNEYKISKGGRSYSYLFDGTPYWTLTKTESKYFLINDVEKSASGSENYNTRVTEFVKHDSVVTGRGSREDPWVFVPVYSVTVTSRGHGTVDGLTASTKHSSRNSSINSVEFSIIPEQGYQYKSNDCGQYAKFQDDKLTITDITNDMECYVTFQEGNMDKKILPQPAYDIKTKLKEFKRTFSAPEPASFYSQYNLGYYKDAKFTQRLSRITLPKADGWTFHGYYVNNIDNKNRIIIGNDTQTGTKTEGLFETKYNLITKQSDTIEYYATQNKYDVTFNKNGGSGGTNSKKVTYDADLPNITVPQQAGYLFSTYSYNNKDYYNSKGEEANIWDVASNAELMANWTPCPKGHKCPGNNTKEACNLGEYQNETAQTTCKKCSKGRYGPSKGLENCPLCPDGQYQDQEGQSSCKDCPVATKSSDDRTYCIPVETEWTFEYTGGAQSVVLPIDGKYEFEVWGASGGGDAAGVGGKGGYAKGTKTMSKGQTVYVYVGGAGADGGHGSGGGYNGGGNPGSYGYSGGGGGATHMATASGLLSSVSDSNLIIAAGGGGGAGCCVAPIHGGNGSGANGSSATSSGGTTSGAGSGCNNGGKGQGGSRSGCGTNGDGGGGGGGYYGGGAARDDGGAGGGSGYTSGLSNVTTTSGERSGHGKAHIKWLGK